MALTVIFCSVFVGRKSEERVLLDKFPEDFDGDEENYDYESDCEVEWPQDQNSDGGHEGAIPAP
jgi:hypothetical protein